MAAPFCTVHVWPAGWASTLTLYGVLLARLAAKVNDVALAGTARLSPPLFCRTSPAPTRPLTVPPIVKGPGGAGRAPMKVSTSPPCLRGLPGRAQANEKPNTLTASVRYAEMSIVVLPMPRMGGAPPPSENEPTGNDIGVAVSGTTASNTVCNTRGETALFQRTSLTWPLVGEPLTPQSGAAR